MSTEKDKLKDGLSSFSLATIVQSQIINYDSIDIYCVKHGESVKYYTIKERYPFLQYIGYTEEEHTEEDILQIIFDSCPFSIETEYIKNKTQIKFL